jgi:putative hydrolase of the HAD superfamily
MLAPDVVEILGRNQLFSYMLGARKPDPELYRRALAHYGCAAEDAFLADDSPGNIAGAREIGITAHLLDWVDGVPRTDALMDAVEAFARRTR